jgi:endothelin-converting enzyme/putative endopeptidase
MKMNANSKHFLSSWHGISLLMAVLGTASLMSGQSSGQAESKEREAQHFDDKAVDAAVDPCMDFYKYACSKWQAANPIPPDRGSFGRGGQLFLHNQWVLRDLLQDAAAKSGKGGGGNQQSPAEQKIGAYYAACTDEKTIDAKGAGALQQELGRISALKDKKQLAAEIAHLHAITYLLTPPSDSGFFIGLFGFSSSQDLDDASKVVASPDQGGITLPDRDYYLKDDAKSQETRQQYVAHVQKMFELLGETPPLASADAATVMKIETALAKASMDIVKRRDPANLNHKLSQQQLQALTPSFDWNIYLAQTHTPTTDHFLVSSPEFFKGVEEQIQSESLADIKTYLRWKLVNAAAPYLSRPFVEENFEFFGKTLGGAKELQPRWKRCVNQVDNELGEALGQAYVESNFGAEGKQRTLHLVKALETALGDDLQQLGWMSPATKTEAIAKLHAIEDKIGYPNKWRDYSKLTISRDDELGNALRGSAFEFQRQLDKIGKPVDRGEWGMTPPTVDAYYDPQLNTINFPAGILQPPFFDKQMDESVNYGAIGSVIGHELTHGFDDQGRKFDAHGNLRDWWTPQDAKAFEARASCVSKEYSGFVATGDVHVNGDLTLGENTADNGGVRISLMALHDTLNSERRTENGIDGMTPEQRFFLAYAQGWCANATPQYLRRLALSNPHSPPEYRVNGVLANMPEFQQAYSCKKGQPMVRENACRVW